MLVFMTKCCFCLEESSNNLNSLKHFIEAMQEFEKDNDHTKFGLHKAQIRDYYNSNQYHNEIIEICKKAESYFNEIVPGEKSLVILDVDDTAIRHYPCYETNLLGIDEPSTKIILPVLDLYKLLIAKGFKIIFITGRSSAYHGWTKIELEEAGYIGFHDLICFPHELYQTNSSRDGVGNWKYSVREKLAQEYDIVGSIGDRDIDFFGGHSGYIVKLPNYLY